VSRRRSLVVLRCRTCRRPLGSVYEVPADWSQTVTVYRCRKCGMPSPGRVVDQLIRHDRTGEPLAGLLPLSAIRDQITAATAPRARRPVDVGVSSSVRADGTLDLHLT